MRLYDHQLVEALLRKLNRELVKQDLNDVKRNFLLLQTTNLINVLTTGCEENFVLNEETLNNSVVSEGEEKKVEDAKKSSK